MPCLSSSITAWRRPEHWPRCMIMTSSQTASSSSSSVETTNTATPDCRGEIPDESVDLGFGADVDALGWLVKQQHGRTLQHGLCKQRLLLIAAR